MYERITGIDNVIYYNFMNAGYFPSFKFALSLRNKYDISVNVYPSNRKEYNVINFIIGAGKRLGVRYKRKDFVNLGFLNNLTIKEDDNLHNVEENIKLVELLEGNTLDKSGKLEFPLSPGDIKYAEDYLAPFNKNVGEIFIGMHAGCSVLKNFADIFVKRFAELAKLLIKNNNARIFLFGGPDEKELKASIANLAGSDKVVIVETGNLGQTAAVIKQLDLFVTNDSSLMHVAAAMQLRTVVIIGPTNTNYIKPWLTEHRIASLNLECAPCFVYSPTPLTCSRTDKKYKCVKDLEVEHVYKEVKHFL